MVIADPRLPLIARGFLKATRDKDEFTLEELSESTRIPLDDVPLLLESLYEVVELENSSDLKSSRFKIFIFLAKHSQNLEDTASLLRWREFEYFTSMILSSLGFDTISSYRFRSSGRRWEIDVLGFREPIILAVDCKHMKRCYRSVLGEVVDRHKARVEAFAPTVRRSFHMIVKRWKTIRIVPIIVTLRRSGYTIIDGFPVVYISALRDFIDSALPILMLDGRLNISEA
ncbi:MAG: hypothetical protein RMJ00_01010 [Nitrososphaerota archaeon]|nr:hypothetical protein [Candidatus Bathyarchaeota archaeon]MCX8162280.1 hypothetical protein [Candidatus Bathyarchaeota archaeon]MDW8061266.1 hypothetical protein [Nitrososphaerota archaeon]